MLLNPISQSSLPAPPKSHRTNQYNALLSSAHKLYKECAAYIPWLIEVRPKNIIKWAGDVPTRELQLIMERVNGLERQT
jgi:hypothetical protein